MESELRHATLFVEHLHKNFGIAREEAYRLLPHLEIERLGRGTHLVRSGTQNDSFYFICSGILHTYQELAGKRLSLSFGFKDSFVFCPDSLFGEVVTDYNIRALRESVVVRISHLKFNGECAEHPELLRLKNRLVQNYADELSLHRQILMKNCASETYRELLGRQGGLAEVPVKHLSSYLGIHPNSLSRIRAGLSEKKNIKGTDQ